MHRLDEPEHLDHHLHLRFLLGVEIYVLQRFQTVHDYLSKE